MSAWFPSRISPVDTLFVRCPGRTHAGLNEPPTPSAADPVQRPATHRIFRNPEMVTQMSFKNFSSGLGSKPMAPANDRTKQAELQDQPAAPVAQPPARPADKD